jgi:DNA-binding GntR family transcriptional regulator
VPEVSRSEAPYLQIANYYHGLIVTGEITSGTRLPPLRDIGAEWGVASATAQRAMDHLKVAGLVHVTTEGGRGHVVNGGLVRLTPRERLDAVQAGGALYLRTERADVTDAGLVPAPEHITDLLGLGAGGEVVRRQTVFREPSGAPGMLAVSWFQPQFAGPVPELAAAAAIPGTGEIGLITERTGRRVTHSGESWRGRAILDDGREGPLLHLPSGAPCLAGAYVWSDREGVLEYGELVLPADRVVSYRHDLG